MNNEEDEENINQSPIDSEGEYETWAQRLKREEEELKIVSWQELSENISRNSLWVIIEAKVYDLSQIIDQFPGGSDMLLKLAGTNATDKLIKIGYSLSRQYQRAFLVGRITNDPMPLDYEFKLKQLKNQNNITIVKLYTQEEINQHKNKWINIDGNIYDLSELLHDHKDYSEKQIMDGINQNQSQIQSILRYYQIGILYNQDERDDNSLNIVGIMGFMCIHILVAVIIKKYQ